MTQQIQNIQTLITQNDFRFVYQSRLSVIYVAKEIPDAIKNIFKLPEMAGIKLFYISDTNKALIDALYIGNLPTVLFIRNGVRLPTLTFTGTDINSFAARVKTLALKYKI